MQETPVQFLHPEDLLEKEQATHSRVSRTFLVAQLVKNLPTMRETPVRSLGPEDPLKKGMAIHSSILAWRIPWTIQSTGSQSRTGLSKATEHACTCYYTAGNKDSERTNSLYRTSNQTVQFYSDDN